MSVVNLLDGKYTIAFDDKTGRMSFLRNGESWQAGNDEFAHAGVVSALVQRVIELEASTTFSAELVSIPVKIDAKDAINAVDGMKDLVVAAMKFCKKVDDGEARSEVTYSELKSALNKIAEKHILDDMSFDPVPGPQASFFNLAGNPGIPDIEEDLGRLLVAIDRGLDFMHNPPSIEFTDEQFHAIYKEKIVDLIPKVRTLVENRIMVKHPFNVLADMFSQGGMPEGVTGSQRFYHAVGKIEETLISLAKATPSKDAVEVMDCLAYMATYMQVIMNLYGWSWDDVKLKARQQMAKAGV